jgi:hypothetical protein
VVCAPERNPGGSVAAPPAVGLQLRRELLAWLQAGLARLQAELACAEVSRDATCYGRTVPGCPAVGATWLVSDVRGAVAAISVQHDALRGWRR